MKMRFLMTGFCTIMLGVFFNIINVETAEALDPVCGSSDGSVFFDAPIFNLCNVGRATFVTGSGPWSWRCMTSPEDIIECSTRNAQDLDGPRCGASSGAIFEIMPTTDLCVEGDVTAVTGTGPWSWTCALDEQEVSCRASKVSDSLDSEESEEDGGAIGNTVWNDRNKNGMQDEGEEGIAGVKLRLYNGNHVKKDYTNSQGRYKFDDLYEGQYRVVVAQDTIPAGCIQTYDKDGELDNKIKTRIKNDQNYTKADFGYYCPSKIIGGGISPRTGSGAIVLCGAFVMAIIGAGYVYIRKIA